MAESKSAKKNKKRRAGQNNPKTGDMAGFEIDEDTAAPPPKVAVSPPKAAQVVDPIADLKRQIEEAKAAKDHVKAQELRQKMWVLRDTLSLGKAGPGAPDVDIQDELAAVRQPTEKLPVTGSSVRHDADDTTEKKLSRLHKKLKKVEELKAKRDRGEKLEVNQIDKIKTESDILEEISILEELLTGS